MGIAQQLYGVAEAALRGGQQPAPPQAPPQQSPSFGGTTAAPAIAPDDFVTGRDVERLGQQFAQQYMQPHIQRSIELTAGTNLDLAKQRHPDIFAKYGQEVFGYLGNVPKEQWTGQNLDTVVDIIRGRHVAEIAREQAERLYAEREPTLRSGGFNGASGGPISQPNADLSLQSEKLNPEWQKKALAVGLTETKINEFCQGSGMSLKQFYEMVGKGGIITELSSTEAGSPLQRQRTGDL